MTEDADDDEDDEDPDDPAGPEARDVPDGELLEEELRAVPVEEGELVTVCVVGALLVELE